MEPTGEHQPSLPPATGAQRPASEPSLRLRLLVPLVVVVLVAQVAVAVTVTRHATDLLGSSARQPSTGAPSAPRTSTPTPTQSANAAPQPAVDRYAALTALLDRRAAALRAGDKPGWLAAVDPAATAFLASQTTVFDAVTTLPLAQWSYHVDGAADPLPASVLAQGRDAWLARVTLRYRLEGFDEGDVLREQFLTVVRQGSGWRIAGDREGEAGGHVSDRDLWDLGKVGVVRGKSSIVIGRVGAASLRGYAAEADRAVTAVTGVWGRSWPQRVVVVVPRSQQEMATLLRSSGKGLDQIAAVTTDQVTPGTDQTGSNRIVINQTTYRTLGALGRRVVFTHETTHVATNFATRRGVPIWLSEGFADYVGYKGTGVPVDVAAEDLIALVRKGKAPKALPAEPDFDASRGSIAPAYESAWLACRMIAATYGERALVRFYQAAGGASVQDADAAAAAAFRSVLHTDESHFVVAWRRYLAAQAGQ